MTPLGPVYDSPNVLQILSLAPLTDQVQMFNRHLANNYTGPSGDEQIRLYYLGLDYAGSILILVVYMFNIALFHFPARLS